MSFFYLSGATALAQLRQRVTRAGSDRGDSPIPSAVIIAGLAVIAIALLGWLTTFVWDYLQQAPTDLPEPPFGQ